VTSLFVLPHGIDHFGSRSPTSTRCLPQVRIQSSMPRRGCPSCGPFRLLSLPSPARLSYCGSTRDSLSSGISGSTILPSLSQWYVNFFAGDWLFHVTNAIVLDPVRWRFRDDNSPYVSQNVRQICTWPLLTIFRRSAIWPRRPCMDDNSRGKHEAAQGSSARALRRKVIVTNMIRRRSSQPWSSTICPKS